MKNISFDENKFSVLLDVNRRGKSTLFRIIAGLQKGYNGDIRIFNIDMSKMSYVERVPLIVKLAIRWRTAN